MQFGGTGLGGAAAPAGRVVLASDGAGGYRLAPAEPVALVVVAAGGAGPVYEFRQDPQNAAGMTVSDGVTAVSLPLPSQPPARQRPPAPTLVFRRVAVTSAEVDIFDSGTSLAQSGASDTRVAIYSGPDYVVAGAPVVVSEVLGPDGPLASTTFSRLGAPSAAPLPVSVSWGPQETFHRVAVLALTPNGVPGLPERLYFTSAPPAATLPTDPAAASGTQVILPEVDVATGPEPAEVYPVILRCDASGTVLDADGDDAVPQPRVGDPALVTSFPSALGAEDSLELWFELRDAAKALIPAPASLGANSASAKAPQVFLTDYLARSAAASPPGSYAALPNVQSFFYRPLVFFVDMFDNVACVDFGATFLPSSGVAVAVVRATSNTCRILFEFPEGVAGASLEILPDGGAQPVYSQAVSVSVSPVGDPVSRVDFREDPSTLAVSLKDTRLRRDAPKLVVSGDHSFDQSDYIYSGTSLSLDDGQAVARFQDASVPLGSAGAGASGALAAWFRPPAGGFAAEASLLTLAIAEGAPSDTGAPYWTAEVALASRMTPRLTVSLRSGDGAVIATETYVDQGFYSEEMLGSWHHAAVALEIDGLSESATGTLAIDGDRVCTLTLTPNARPPQSQADRALRGSFGPAQGFLLDDMALYASPATPDLNNPSAPRFTVVDVPSGYLAERQRYVARLTTSSIGSNDTATHDRAFATQDSTAPVFLYASQYLVADPTDTAASSLEVSWSNSADTREVLVEKSEQQASAYVPETTLTGAGPHSLQTSLNKPWEDTHVRLTARDSASQYRREIDYETVMTTGAVVPKAFPDPQQPPPTAEVKARATVTGGAYDIGIAPAALSVRVQGSHPTFSDGATPVPDPVLGFAMFTARALESLNSSGNFAENALAVFDSLEPASAVLKSIRVSILGKPQMAPQHSTDARTSNF